jgi:acyl carrier protein
MNVDAMVREVFEQVLKIDGSTLDGQIRLVEDLAIDSLDSLELAVRIQDSFQIEMDEQDFARFTTFGQVVDCVREVLARTAA